MPSEQPGHKKKSQESQWAEPSEPLSEHMAVEVGGLAALLAARHNTAPLDQEDDATARSADNHLARKHKPFASEDQEGQHHD